MPPQRRDGISRSVCLILSLFVHLLVPVAAESIVFDNEVVPWPGEARGWYIFRAYSRVDFEVTNHGKSSLMQQTAVELELAAQGVQPLDPFGEYPSLEAVVVYQEDFDMQFDRHHFCSEGRFQIPAKGDLELAHVRIPLITLGSPPDHGQMESLISVPINKTGSYLFLLSNCGNATVGQVSGHVRVLNPYGYLPPEQYHKEGPLKFILVLYILAGAGWLAHGASMITQFYEVHFYFTGVAILSILELASKLYALQMWNDTASFEPWMSVATFAYVLKWVFFYLLAVYIGGGFYDRSSQEKEAKLATASTLQNISAVCTLYAALLTIRESTMYGSRGLNLGASALVLSSLPVIVMDAAFVVHLVFLTMAEYHKSEKVHDYSRSSLFGKLHTLSLVFALVGACSVMLELLHLSGTLALSWRTQWIPSEGVAHFICFTGLGCSMVAMRPGAVERRSSKGKVAPGDGEDSSLLADAIGRAEALER